MKKFISVLLALTLFLSTFALSASATDTKDDLLRFNPDGKFKIIQVSDLQDNTNPVKKTAEYLREIAEDEKPDLFILTGDNISDSVARGFTKAHSEKKSEKSN